MVFVSVVIILMAYLVPTGEKKSPYVNGDDFAWLIYSGGDISNYDNYIGSSYGI